VRLIALLLGAALLAGCGTEFVADPPRDPAPIPTYDSEIDGAPPEVPNPTAVTIPKIGAHSTLIPLGLTGVTKDCPKGDCLDVPPVDTPEQAAWYAGEDTRTEDADGDGRADGDGDEYKPGDPDGPAILSGHVDGTGPSGEHGFPGVFARLGELVAGDEILIDREDGSQLKFVVTAVERYSKDALPWDRIMAPTEKPSLRAITCGGAFDPVARHYVDNEVAFAELAS
jgi:sortase family protein